MAKGISWSLGITPYRMASVSDKHPWISVLGAKSVVSVLLWVWFVQTGVRNSSQKGASKCGVVDFSSDLDSSAVWAQPVCLALLRMHCTVCHSSCSGLTSPTVKTTGGGPGLPAETQSGNFAEMVVQYPPRHSRGHPAQTPGCKPTNSSKS